VESNKIKEARRRTRHIGAIHGNRNTTRAIVPLLVHHKNPETDGCEKCKQDSYREALFHIHYQHTLVSVKGQRCPIMRAP